MIFVEQEANITLKYLCITKVRANPKEVVLQLCKLVGHDERNCQSYDLMMEHIVDAYRLQAGGHTCEELGKNVGRGGFQRQG